MILEPSKVKEDLRTYIGDIVDLDNFKYMFQMCFMTREMSHLHQCMLLSGKYPEIYEYVKKFIKLINPQELNKKCFRNKTILYSLITEYAERVTTNCIQLLIDYGADVNLVISSKISLLHVIDYYNVKYSDQYIAIIKLLINNGADINFKHNYWTIEMSIIHYLIAHRDNPEHELLEILLKCGATYDLRDIRYDGCAQEKIKNFIEFVENRTGSMTKRAIK